MPQSKDWQKRAHLRQQVSTGKSLKGFDLLPEKLSELWPTFLDLHLQSTRPGRAVALLDVAFMLEHGLFRVTDGSSGASASTDSLASRALFPAELAAIGAWHEGYVASQPAASQPLQEVEQSLAAQASTYHEAAMHSQSAMAADITAAHALLQSVHHDTTGLASLGQALSGKVPERGPGESVRAFTRRQQSAKSAIDIVLRPVRDEMYAESTARREAMYESAEGLSRLNLDDMPLDEAREKLREIEKINTMLVHDSRAKLKMREAEERKKAKEEAAAAKRKANGDAATAKRRQLDMDLAPDK
jgi:hypothetical protein